MSSSTLKRGPLHPLVVKNKRGRGTMSRVKVSFHSPNPEGRGWVEIEYSTFVIGSVLSGFYD